MDYSNLLYIININIKKIVYNFVLIIFEDIF